MIVHKFGGTSVGDAQRFAGVADIVIEHYNNGPAPGEVMVVVSAMSGVTNQLIAGARAAAEGKDTVHCEIKAGLLNRHLDVIENLSSHSPERLEVGGLVEDRLHELERLYRNIAVRGELTVRGRDVVASFGEQLSISILAAVLREQGVRAQAISATQLIVTDDNVSTGPGNTFSTWTLRGTGRTSSAKRQSWGCCGALRSSNCLARTQPLRRRFPMNKFRR